MRQTSRQSAVEWFFFSGGPGAPRYGGDPTKHAVDHDTSTFVREVLQNANDQRLPGDDPVEVTFRFVTLSGDDLSEFLNALGWEDGLRERLAAVAGTENGRGYEQFLGQLEGDGESELRLLVVEDRNTTGLIGDWDGDSNYAALVRDELYSSKQDETAGGSYGLGKSVLWTFSGASTVVFNSHLGRDRVDRDMLRLIARTKLPTHRLNDDGREYQGAGWLCRPQESDEGPRPESIWGPEASRLADRLHVDRPHVSGTSAMVVGFRDPTRDTRPDVEDLADEFLNAAVKYFWPAIYQGDLRVTVEADGETREADVDRVPAVTPFVDCYANRYDGVEELEVPGDVASVDVDIGLPPGADGSETVDGPVRLTTRLASPADEDELLNHVALFRGSGMVVKYYDQSRVAFGDRNFFGVLACGESRPEGRPTVADREIDRFLRFAEPPTHDDWESTENLRDHYQRGFRTALDEMFAELREGLRFLVSRTRTGGDALSERVLKQFPIHGDGRRRTVTGQKKAFELEGASTFRDGRWTFSGNVTPLVDEFTEWSAEVSLTGVGEDGNTVDQLPVEQVSVDDESAVAHVEDGVAKIVAEGDVGRVSFDGASGPVGGHDVSRGRVGETRLEIEAQLQTEGDQA